MSIIATWLKRTTKRATERAITEVFQEIFTWLKEKSERIYHENDKNPKIIAELKPEWQLEHVEITPFIGRYEQYFRHPLLGTSKIICLKILGVDRKGYALNLFIKDRNPFEKTILEPEFKENVKSGDPVFDRWHIVKSGTPEIAIKFLKDEKFREYIRNIHKLKVFKVKGNGNLSFTVKCNYDTISAKNAILAMKRISEILASEIKPQETKSSELLLNLRKEFEKLSISVSELKFEPSEENFTDVIITPLLGEIDFIHYNITEKLKVKALGSLRKTVDKTVEIQIFPRGVKLDSNQQAYHIEQLKNSFEIKCNNLEVLQKISEANVLLKALREIKEIFVFNIKLQDQRMEIYLECGLNPGNIEKAYEVMKEVAWWIKFNLLI